MKIHNLIKLTGHVHAIVHLQKCSFQIHLFPCRHQTSYHLQQLLKALDSLPTRHPRIIEYKNPPLSSIQGVKIRAYLPCIVYKYAVTYIKERFIFFIQLILPVKFPINCNTVIPAKTILIDKI